jgi:hypothetical protein
MLRIKSLQRPIISTKNGLQLRSITKTRLLFGHLVSAGILEQSMEARKRVGIRLSYRPAGLHRLAESIHYRFIIDSLESIPGYPSLKV